MVDIAAEAASGIIVTALPIRALVRTRIIRPDGFACLLHLPGGLTTGTLLTDVLVAWSGCADSTGDDNSYALIGPSAWHLRQPIYGGSGYYGRGESSEVTD